MRGLPISTVSAVRMLVAGEDAGQRFEHEMLCPASGAQRLHDAAHPLPQAWRARAVGIDDLDIGAGPGRPRLGEWP